MVIYSVDDPSTRMISANGRGTFRLEQHGEIARGKQGSELEMEQTLYAGTIEVEICRNV